MTASLQAKNYTTIVSTASSSSSPKSKPIPIPTPKRSSMARHPIAGRSISSIPLAMGGPNLYAYNYPSPARPSTGAPLSTCIGHPPIPIRTKTKCWPSDSEPNSDSMSWLFPLSTRSLSPSPSPSSKGKHKGQVYISVSPPRKVVEEVLVLPVSGHPSKQFMTCELCCGKHLIVDRGLHVGVCVARRQSAIVLNPAPGAR